MGLRTICSALYSFTKAFQSDSDCNVFKISCYFAAAQMWLLGRLIPFLVGKYVDEDDAHWKNYLMLLEILDYLMAPDISEDEVGYLSFLIMEHHRVFIELYSSSNMIPKHHFMIHMARLILTDYRLN